METKTLEQICDNEQEFRMSKKTFGLLKEALRRYECFAVRQRNQTWDIESIVSNFTGYGNFIQHQIAVDEGYMVPNEPDANRGHTQWWSLTEKGARLILKWHEQGFTCGEEWKLVTMPDYENYKVIKLNPIFSGIGNIR